jgi:hypothetical protein
MRQQKRGLQLQKSGVMRKENSREKRKEISWRVQLQGLITTRNSLTTNGFTDGIFSVGILRSKLPMATFRP